MTEKLQKLISRAGLTSRRKAEEWISQGRVSVNGTVAKLGDRADSEHDKIAVDGRLIHFSDEQVVVLLNKPRGYVCTLNDPQGRPVVTQLVSSIPLRLYPVGRLDCNSEGLLLMTNDGDLAHRLMHPRHHVEKCYLVKIQGNLNRNEQQKMTDGVRLDDGTTAPAKVTSLRSSGPNSWFEIVLQEGKNRQVRRMCEAVGHRVLRLKRIRIDFLELGDLKAGSFRVLSAQEIQRLKRG